MVLIFESLKACAMWIPIIALTVIGILTGLLIVPVALFFVKINKEYQEWELINLPRFFYLWDNIRDGVIGDRRLDYWNNGKQYPLWFDKLPLSQYVKAYYWLAIRNPANTLKRYVPFMGCKVGIIEGGYEYIHLLAGQEYVSDVRDVQGFQFVKTSKPKEMLSYWGFYLYKQVTSDRYLMIRLGHKIEPRHMSEEFTGERANKAWKGTTFRIALRSPRY